MSRDFSDYKTDENFGLEEDLGEQCDRHLLQAYLASLYGLEIRLPDKDRKRRRRLSSKPHPVPWSLDSWSRNPEPNKRSSSVFSFWMQCVVGRTKHSVLHSAILNPEFISVQPEISSPCCKQIKNELENVGAGADAWFCCAGLELKFPLESCSCQRWM